MAMTKAGVRYSQDVEANAVLEVLANEGRTGWGWDTKNASYVLSELVGVGRFIANNGTLFQAIEDGSDLLEGSKLLAESDDTVENRTSFVYAVAEIVKRSSRQEGFSFSSQIVLVRDVLKEQWSGSELSNEATISLAMAAHIIADTPEDMDNWYARERKYPTADDLLEARGITSTVLQEVRDYFDPEAGMPKQAIK